MQKLERDDIVSILKNEHNVVRANFKKILENKSPIRDIYSQTAEAVLNHFNGEEKLVFPAFESNKDSLTVVYALYEEHGLVRKQISELNSLTAASENDRWLAKAMVINSLLESHFALEESQVFPKAENMLTIEQREDIGRRYKNKQF
jgi:hemerythrin-like domain-containing protein